MGLADYFCCKDSYFIRENNKRLKDVQDLEIKDYMKIRYLRVVDNLEKSSKSSSFLYHTLTGIVTAGTILTSSLITVQDKSRNNEGVYWGVWSISLSVTLSNAIIKMWALDKSYISRNIKLNQFKSEGSLYFSKAGIYNIEDDKERFKLFVSNIEKLKKEMIMDEYLQNDNHVRDSTENISLV